MGFGLMSCATFGEVSDLSVRYLKTRVPYFTLSKSIEGDQAVVQAREVVQAGRWCHWAHFTSLGLIILWQRCIKFAELSPIPKVLLRRTHRLRSGLIRRNWNACHVAHRTAADSEWHGCIRSGVHVPLLLL